MSRIGKLPVVLVEWVSAKIDGDVITITGPKGTLTMTKRPEVSVVQEGNELLVSIPNPADKAYRGLTRALINNMVEWVTQGYERKLQVIWVWYNAKVQGSTLVLNLGYSHPVNHALPAGIEASVEKDPKWNDMVVLKSIDKQLVGEQAAKIRAYRKPEPYKWKWVRHRGEVVKMKAGKTATKK